MATALLMAQQVFSSLGGNACLNATAVNGTAAQGSTGSMDFPTDFSSLISFLLSASALSNWLKLALFGSLLETCRRLVFHFYYKLYNSIFITARFEEEDVSYNWMMLWLAAQPSWRKARDVQISTRSFGLNNSAVMIDGEDDDPSNVVNTNRQLAYIPSLSSSHSFWYNKHWVRVTRSQQDGGYYGRKEDVLELCIMSLDHSVLNSILREAKKAYMAAQEHMISVFVSDTSNNWRHIASRPKRPLNSIVLDPGIKDLLIDDARDFLESKGWYAARGIPFRRGYLLYGAPGSGKTSIIHSLAGELGLDVYVVSLSRVGMDDTSLGEIIAELPEKCIALMEDIDAAFSQTLNREEDSSDAEESNDKEKKKEPRKSQSAPPTTTSRVTLSGLLNALDGVGAQEGRILFATTNKYTSLDPALCRPGRMDIHIEFKLASRYQARELYRCFYLPDQDDGTNKVKTEKEKNGDDDGDSDSGYSSISEKEKESCPPSPSESSPLSPPASATSFSGSSHRARPPKLSLRKVDLLADRFATAIPERELSMAALQGYLMAYKVRPFDAVRDAAGWVEKERAERISKLKSSSETPKIQKTEDVKEEGKTEATATTGEEISS